MKTLKKFYPHFFHLALLATLLASSHAQNFIYDIDTAFVENDLLSGSGALIKDGNGLLVLTRNNTYTGGTQLVDGTILFEEDPVDSVSFDRLPTVGRVFVGGDAVLNLNGYDQALEELDVVSTAFLQLGSATLEITTGLSDISGVDGLVTGTGNIIKGGNGELHLHNANTFSGGLTIYDGSVFLNNNTAAGSGTIEWDFNDQRDPQSPVLEIAGGLTIANDFYIGLSEYVIQVDLGTVTHTGNTNNSGAFLEMFKTGNGTLILEGTNHTGSNTTINGGTLRVGASDAIGSGVISLAGGSLDLAGGITLANPINLSDTDAINVDSGTVILSGSLDDGIGSNLIKTGDGTLRLTSTNNFAGDTTVSGGTLQITTEAALSVFGGSLTLDGATLHPLLDENFFGIDSHPTILGSGGGTIQVDYTEHLGSELQFFLYSAIFGNGSLTKTGDGTLILRGVNTYTGDTTIANGTLRLRDDEALGDAGNSLFFDGGFLQPADTAHDTDRDFSITANGGGFDVDDGFDYTVNGVISGSGTLTKKGADTLILDAVNTYTGGTVIEAGTLQLTGGDNRLPTVGRVYLANSGVTLDLNNRDQEIAELDAVTGTTVDLGSGDLTLTSGGGIISGVDGAVIGTGSLTHTGGGEVHLHGNNTFSGGVTNTSSGTILLNHDNAAGTGNITLEAGRLKFGNGVDISNAVVLEGNATFNINTGLTATQSGTISNSGGAFALTKIGGGTLTLTGANTYAGGTTINNGTLAVSNTTGSATGVGDVFVEASAVLHGSGTVTGAVEVSGTIAPGDSPGTMNTGSQIWNSGGTYLWEINDATGTAGMDPGWDLLNITGDLTIAATELDPFAITVTSLQLDGNAGEATNFELDGTYSWLIASTTIALSGFTANHITIDTSSFANLPGTDRFFLSTIGNDLYLNYAIPEPHTWAMIFGLAAFGYAVWMRRRKR